MTLPYLEQNMWISWCPYLPISYWIWVFPLSFSILEVFLRGESTQKSLIMWNIMNATKMKNLQEVVHSRIYVSENIQPIHEGSKDQLFNNCESSHIILVGPDCSKIVPDPQHKLLTLSPATDTPRRPWLWCFLRLPTIGSEIDIHYC